jgi:hypothetical protein
LSHTWKILIANFSKCAPAAWAKTARCGCRQRNWTNVLERGTDWALSMGCHRATRAHGVLGRIAGRARRRGPKHAKERGAADGVAGQVGQHTSSKLTW